MVVVGIRVVGPVVVVGGVFVGVLVIEGPVVVRVAVFIGTLAIAIVIGITAFVRIGGAVVGIVEVLAVGRFGRFRPACAALPSPPTL